MRYGECGTLLVVSGLEGAAINAAADQDLALARMVGGGHEAFLLHALDQRGCLVIAHRQAALNIARRALAVAQHDGHGAIIEIATLFRIHAAGAR